MDAYSDSYHRDDIPEREWVRPFPGRTLLLHFLALSSALSSADRKTGRPIIAVNAIISDGSGVRDVITQTVVRVIRPIAPRENRSIFRANRQSLYHASLLTFTQFSRGRCGVTAVSLS